MDTRVSRAYIIHETTVATAHSVGARGRQQLRRPALFSVPITSKYARFLLWHSSRWCASYYSSPCDTLLSARCQAIHARSGVPYEIMGIMQGKVVGKALVIIDSFALPVQGTETRVNAANEANEYMVQYVQGSERVRLSLWPLSNCQAQYIKGIPPRECDRMVSLSPRIWMLVIWNRRKHPDQ